jgi:hypothetical protein
VRGLPDQLATACADIRRLRSSRRQLDAGASTLVGRLQSGLPCAAAGCSASSFAPGATLVVGPQLGWNVCIGEELGRAEVCADAGPCRRPRAGARRRGPARSGTSRADRASAGGSDAVSSVVFDLDDTTIPTAVDPERLLSPRRFAAVQRARAEREALRLIESARGLRSTPCETSVSRGPAASAARACALARAGDHRRRPRSTLSAAARLGCHRQPAGDVAQAPGGRARVLPGGRLPGSGAKAGPPRFRGIPWPRPPPETPPWQATTHIGLAGAAGRVRGCSGSSGGAGLRFDPLARPFRAAPGVSDLRQLAPGCGWQGQAPAEAGRLAPGTPVSAQVGALKISAEQSAEARARSAEGEPLV